MAVQLPYGITYEHVNASTTAQVLGGTGAIGDTLMRLVITVSTAAGSAVSIQDGASFSHTIMAANTPIGAYSLDIMADSQFGAWKVTTGSGVEALAIGDFS